MIVTNTWSNRQAMRCALPMGACLYGGDSSSDASQKTYQADNRVVGGEGSQNISGTGNSISVNTTLTDGGATASAIDFAKLATVLTITSAEDLQANTLKVFNTSVQANQNSLDLVRQSYGQAYSGTADAYRTALSGLDKAYETAKAGDQREVSMFVTVAIALTVAVTLAAVFGKKKG